MTEAPKIENAPGLKWRRNKAGWEARWRARGDVVRRGYKPKVMRLWCSTVDEPTLSAARAAWIADRCNDLQSDMLVWSRGGITVTTGLYDGTLGSLIVCYQTDPDSSYREKRFRTREHYDTLCRKIEPKAATKVLEIDARLLKAWYREWAEGGKLSVAHSTISMVRTLMTFGATMLKRPECREVKVTMHDMRFKMAPRRDEQITAQYAVAVRAMAHDMGYPSIALQQSLQFDLAWRQKDGLGEWEPLSEPGVSDVIAGSEKWLRGVRWEEIDEKLVVRHISSKRGKLWEGSLTHAPMVMEELIRRYPDLVTLDEQGNATYHRDVLPASGPVVICEDTGLPWHDHNFRRRWRIIARAAGVPDHVFNMDSRAGAITETTDSGMSIESARQLAQHSNTSTTEGYSRGRVQKVEAAMKARAAHRNKTGTDNQ